MDGKLTASVIASLVMGGGSGAGLSYYVQESNARSIEKLEAKQERIDEKIYKELREMNTRLSKIEGRLDK